MPILRKTHSGQTSREFTEGYHFHPQRSSKKIVQITAHVPPAESLSNPRYIAVEEVFSRGRTALAVHDCRVVISKDMYLVTGYWDGKAVVNRSILTTVGQVWKGEVAVTCAGRYIPFKKRVKNGPAAEAAAKFFIKAFKAYKAQKKRIPTTIVAKNLPG